jgi:hypothetical protein
VSAIEQSIAMWPSPEAFWNDVRKWGEMGCYVHIRPDFCVCAKDVEGQGWYVYLAVGDMEHMLRQLPYELEFIGWDRELRGCRNPRYYPLKKLLAKCGISSIPSY